MANFIFKVTGRTGNWKMLRQEGQFLLVQNTLTQERTVVLASQVSWSRRV